MRTMQGCMLVSVSVKAAGRRAQVLVEQQDSEMRSKALFYVHAVLVRTRAAVRDRLCLACRALFTFIHELMRWSGSVVAVASENPQLPFPSPFSMPIRLAMCT